MAAMRMEGPDPTNVIGRRIIAFVVDMLAIAILMAAVYAVFGLEASDPNEVAPAATPIEGSQTGIALLYLTPLAYIIGVMIVWQGLTGYTAGKLVAQVKTVKFDGRAPGILKGIVRAIPLWIGTLFLGCIWWVICLLVMSFVKGHRRPGDMLANTFVIDTVYAGRIITIGAERASAGPESLYAEEAAAGAAMAQGQPAPNVRPSKPTYDKTLDTYIVWDNKQNCLMKFDKASKTWTPV